MGVVLPWTQEEDATLSRMRGEGKTFREIVQSGKLPGRSWVAVANRLSRQKNGQVPTPRLAPKPASDRPSTDAFNLARRICTGGPIPVVSLGLEELSAEKDCALFERDGRRVCLSSYGWRALEALETHNA